MTKKFIQHYKPADIASIINEFITSLQSTNGDNFKSLHVLDDTIIVKISNQSFIISITEKDRLS